MKVLVCGGREYGTMVLHDKTYVNEKEVGFLNGALSVLHAITPITTLVHGAAKGADLLADEWGYYAGVNVAAYPANWGQRGRAAGPLRNREMLTKENPDIVIAFPGGTGTADMVEISLKKFETDGKPKVIDLRHTNN